MPNQTLRLVGGVVSQETPALNEAGISASNLIRIKPDPKGMSLPEKIGGWAAFYVNQVTQTVRAILGWQDTNANKWVAYGTSSTTNGNLVISQCFTDPATGITTADPTSRYSYNITPQLFTYAAPMSFSTTAGSTTVTVVDTRINGLNTYDSVYFATPVSVGGIVISGQYQITPTNTANTYTIQSTNLFGLPAPAAYTTLASPITVVSGSYTAGNPNQITLTFGALGSPPFSIGENINITGITPKTWNGSCVVTACTNSSVTVNAPYYASGSYISGGSITNNGVTPVIVDIANFGQMAVYFPEHGLSVGSTFNIPLPTAVGTVILQGSYTVAQVTNNYYFAINTGAQYTATGFANNYQNGLIVTGGSSTTTAVTLTCDGVTYSPPKFAIIGGSSSTTVVTLTFQNLYPYTSEGVSFAGSNGYLFPVGSSIYVSGITSPSSWNGTFTVTASSAGSVSYSLSGAALSWGSGGTVTTPIFNVGDSIYVSGVTPTTWEGNFTVTNATDKTVTYALSGSALSWVSGGAVSVIGGNVACVYSVVPQTPSLAPFLMGNSIPATNWSMDNWGSILVSSPSGTPLANIAASLSTRGNSLYVRSQNYVNYGPLYACDPTTGPFQSTVIINGPPVVTGFFVSMPQRQIVAWGTSFTSIVDPLLIRWCDVNNYNVWIGQITNQAGSYRLTSGSAIIGARQTSQQALFWTDIGVWSMQYIGPPYVYSFNEIGKGCGLIARRAAAELNGVIYWLGQDQFYVFNAGGISVLPCPVWDVLFQDLDASNVSKIIAAPNSVFDEISWYYPVAGGSGENSAYIKYNVSSNTWDIGSIGRTAWTDKGVLGPPIGYDPVNQYLYQHEISTDAGGSAMTPSFTTGYFAVAEGDSKAFLDQFWPDFKWGYYNVSQNASISITFNGCDYPGETPTTYGPFTVTKATKWLNPRIRNRLISITVSSSDSGTWWRLGAFRYRAEADGKF